MKKTLLTICAGAVLWAGYALADTVLDLTAASAFATNTVFPCRENGETQDNACTGAQVVSLLSAATQTLTNKTLDANGTGNSISNIETGDIAAAALTGSDTDFVTGTAGTNGNLVQWNGDGDAVDSTVAAADVYAAGGTDVPVTDGGTGSSTAAGARTNLGVSVTAFEYVIDGGGSAITTGEKGCLQAPYAVTITDATLLADQSGSIVIDVWVDSYANYPPDNADSITASAVPTLSAAAKSTDGTLTGWTTSVSAGDILCFNVDSAATVERVTIVLEATR